MARNLVVGIDPGDYCVKVVVARRRKERDFPRLLAVYKGASRGFLRGQVVDEDDARASVREAVEHAGRRAGERITNAYISINDRTLSSHVHDGAVIAQRADSEIVADDVRRAEESAETKIAGRANLQILESIPLAYRLDGEEIDGLPVGLVGSKLSIEELFMTCQNNTVERTIDCIESASVAVDGFLPPALAAQHVTISKPQKRAGCVVIDIGAQATRLGVFEEGLIRSVETLAIGSQDITNDIALGLRVSLEEAEAIKQGKQGYGIPARRFEEIVSARVSDIFELANEHLKSVGRSGLLPAGAVLTGGGALVPKIDEYAREILGLPARIAVPLFPQTLTSSEDAHGEKIFIKDPSMSVAYGLAVYGNNPPRASHTLKIGSARIPMMRTVSRFLKNFLP